MTELLTGGHDGWFDQFIRSQVLKIRPKSIFDVGAGKGLNAKIIRELYAGALGRGLRIHGIEIFEPHIPNITELYDYIRVGDVREMSDYQWSDESGDLVIFGDVLEHMEEQEAMDVVIKALPHFKYMIINTPLGFLEHEEMDGNKYEAHICGLYPEDFEAFDIIEKHVRDTGEWAGLFNLLIRGLK